MFQTDEGGWVGAAACAFSAEHGKCKSSVRPALIEAIADAEERLTKPDELKA
jgi:hypothetical protein